MMKWYRKHMGELAWICRNSASESCVVQAWRTRQPEETAIPMALNKSKLPSSHIGGFLLRWTTRLRRPSTGQHGMLPLKYRSRRPDQIGIVFGSARFGGVDIARIAHNHR